MSDYARFCTVIPFLPVHPPEWVPPDSVVIEDGLENSGHSLTPFVRTDGSKGLASMTNIYRQGFGISVNRAVERAYECGYDYALIWNSDAAPHLEGDVTQNYWLGRLEAILKENPTVGAVAPAKLLTAGERAKLSHLPGEAADNIGVYFEPTSTGSRCVTALAVDEGHDMGQNGGVVNSLEVRTGEHVSVGIVNVTGLGYAPLFAVRIEAFLAAGGYDPVFTPGFYEDADLWIRLRRYGYLTLVDPSLAYRHGDETGNSKTFEKAHKYLDWQEQGHRAWRLLMVKWGILPPLEEPLLLSHIDPRRRKVVVGEDGGDGPGENARRDAPCQSEAESAGKPAMQLPLELGGGE